MPRGLAEPEFPKYPRLPVKSCRGFEAAIGPLLIKNKAWIPGRSI